MIARTPLCAALCFAFVGATAAAPAPSRTNNIGDVFQDFETICFTYARKGYSVELTFLIEQAGFQAAGKTGGDDVFNSDRVQLIVGDNGCAFGMANLPFAQMLEWTKLWIASEGLTFKDDGTRANGEPYSRWSAMGFEVRLEGNKFPDGTPLTALMVERR